MASDREERPRPERITGVRHFFAAAGYSLAGLARLWNEAAFRHELLGAVVVVGLLGVTGASAPEFIGFGVLFLLLVAFEALNTAIECVVDHVSPGWAEFARQAKDLGSLAVMCMLWANGLFLGYVLFW